MVHMENWYRETKLPDDYWVVPTPNGWINDITAFECIKSIRNSPFATRVFVKASKDCNHSKAVISLIQPLGVGT
jgi:hypothetical protein